MTASVQEPPGKGRGVRALTWLLVDGGQVDLKAADVGQKEGQSPPVAHLGVGGGDGNQRVLHTAFRNLGTDLYLDDFIKEDLRILLELKLEVLKKGGKIKAGVYVSVLPGLLPGCVLKWAFSSWM